MGEDVILVYNPKSGKSGGCPCESGHVAVLIGNSNCGWYYFSKNGDTHNKGDYYESRVEFYKANPCYKEEHRIECANDFEAIRAGYKETSTYWSTRNNCADAVQKILAAGGIVVSGAGSNYYSYPSVLLKNARNDYPYPQMFSASDTVGAGVGSMHGNGNK